MKHSREKNIILNFAKEIGNHSELMNIKYFNNLSFQEIKKNIDEEVDKEIFLIIDSMSSLSDLVSPPTACCCFLQNARRIIRSKNVNCKMV